MTKKLSVGYFVDHETETVSEVTITDDYRDIYKRIGCECFEAVYVNNLGDSLFIDEEGLLKPGGKVFLLAGNDHIMEQYLVGNALLLGCDFSTGEQTARPKMSLEEFSGMVTFCPHLETK